MLLRNIGLGIMCLWGSLSIATEQQSDITITSLAENVLLLSGQQIGANVGVVVDNEQVLLIDTIVNKHSKKLIDAIEKVTAQPVTHIVNTHGDFDHTGVNAYYRNLGAKVIAQKSVSYSKVTCDLCFEDSLSFQFSSDTTIEMRSAVVHSFSDNIIHIPRANVVFMGDILTNVSHPTFYKGGISGLQEAIDYAVNLGDEKTKYVAGHGFVINKKQLQRYLSTTKKIVELVILKHRNRENTEEIFKSTEFIQLYSQLENKVSIQDTNPDRLKRFIKRIVATQITADTHVNLVNYTGSYLWEHGSDFRLVYKDSKLLYQEKNRRVVELIPLNETMFKGRGQIDRYYRFTFNNKGAVDLMTYYLPDNTSYISKRITKGLNENNKR